MVLCEGVRQLKLGAYQKVSTVKEAMDLLDENKESVLIAGGAWLKLSNKKYDLGIDISELEFNKIEISDKSITIGAMVKLQDVATNEKVAEFADGIVSTAANRIMGTTVRNVATIGGCICGRFGFSDIITPLLALGAQLNFYKMGTVSLEEYLQIKNRDKDILMSITLSNCDCRGYFDAIKKTSLDFSIINVSVVYIEDEVNIAIGSRPGVATLRKLSYSKVKESISDNAANNNEMAVIEDLVSNVKMGSNTRASEKYRREVAKVLVQRGLGEVMA